MTVTMKALALRMLSALDLIKIFPRSNVRLVVSILWIDDSKLRNC